MKLIKLFFPAMCYRPGSVVGDLWWLAGGHVFGGQVHNSQDAYEKRDGTFRKFKGKLASQNSSALENKIPDNIEDLCANIKARKGISIIILNYEGRDSEQKIELDTNEQVLCF